MTERPEERDSLGDAPDPYGNFGPGVTLGASRLSEGTLAEIEARLDEVAGYGVADTLSLLSAELLVIARALINEVKERETERAMWERAAKNGSDRILDLEAEVKELREENAGLERKRAAFSRLLDVCGENYRKAQDQLSVEEFASRNKVEELEATISQMEEALREAERRARDVLPTAKSTGSTAMLSFVQYVRDIRKTIARAALSPSDTEEKA